MQQGSKEGGLKKYFALVRELVALGAPKPAPSADPGLAAMQDVVWPTFKRLVDRAGELEDEEEEVL
ncbi:uncharacterized protein LY79DRAFT_574073 [Colletotrichum navitas]|uniref:Uncharacterized protein n=1 Tax=Colletotrichum navitas TaxID=681940 RepID=A0AAD8PIR5_9PEZI|nr:uncharacterized protein LY79DRAFT_574073 [Colletotrichum navitas]KAK1561581.1 hypothetical protein LY79DRAFT_574073 [Colletotrichum navitas]